MQLPQSFSDLAPYLNKAEILLKTRQQVQKDFAVYGWELDVEPKTHNTYNDLRAEVMPVIDRLLKKQYGPLQELMYRIDVNEGLLKKMLSDFPGRETEVYTDLILWRELQKVVIRTHFHQGRSE